WRVIFHHILVKNVTDFSPLISFNSGLRESSVVLRPVYCRNPATDRPPLVSRAAFRGNGKPHPS
ncbi:MAG: hypothetical protein PHE55_13110, partial [Methylococcaceae bacterium]|nr:hypothetical protein [Methylococcaceae bacterium]